MKQKFNTIESKLKIFAHQCFTMFNIDDGKYKICRQYPLASLNTIERRLK